MCARRVGGGKDKKALAILLSFSGFASHSALGDGAGAMGRPVGTRRGQAEQHSRDCAGPEEPDRGSCAEAPRGQDGSEEAPRRIEAGRSSRRDLHPQPEL